MYKRQDQIRTETGCRERIVKIFRADKKRDPLIQIKRKLPVCSIRPDELEQRTVGMRVIEPFFLGDLILDLFLCFFIQGIIICISSGEISDVYKRQSQHPTDCSGIVNREMLPQDPSIIDPCQLQSTKICHSHLNPVYRLGGTIFLIDVYKRQEYINLVLP